VNAARLYSFWNDNYSITFDWNQFRREGGHKGDLIFTRANSTGSNLVKIFSNWTHVAIAYDPYNQRVFESTPDSGVDINETSRSWGIVCYYTCKRLYNQSGWAIERAVDNAVTNFRYTKYVPQVRTTVALSVFLYKWSNKENTDSMYCSKLAYQTFKPLVNLDSNNTEIMNYEYQDNAPGAPMFSWIGVSPDDIYYSPYLGPDFCISPNLISDGLATAGAK
jgi:hypothetical protein